MTILIGIHAYDSVMLLADTRVTLGHRGSNDFEDGHQKIKTTSTGLFGTFGWTSFTGRIEDILGGSTIENAAAIRRAFDDAREELLFEYGWQGRFVFADENIRLSGCLFTWLGELNGERHIRLGMLHGSWIDDTKPGTYGLLQPGRAELWVNDFDLLTILKNELNAYMDRFSENELKKDQLVDLGASMILRASTEVRGVSPEFFFGVHTIDNDHSVVGPVNCERWLDRTDDEEG